MARMFKAIYYKSLYFQVSLTEERNAVLVPGAESGIPGAPADWDPPLGMEPHVPVLFLDLNGKIITRGRTESDKLILSLPDNYAIY